jgi:HlyD family secretion protein
VKSPIDGVVVSHSVSSGDEVNASAVLCQIADYSKMSMVIPVDELDVSTVFIGQEAKITVEALPGRTFRGEVTKIATEGVIKDGVATYEVTVTLLETNGLRGSMTATATIKTQVKENALLVPSEAVRSIRGKRVLQVMRDGKAEPVEVSVGLSNGSFTEILSGIKDGDTVQITQSDRKKLNPFTGQEG